MKLEHESKYICECENWEEPVLYPVAELIRCREERRRMIEKENIFARFLKWIGLIKKTPVDKSEMCNSAQSVCNRECDECIWGMYDCAERKEE